MDIAARFVGVSGHSAHNSAMFCSRISEHDCVKKYTVSLNPSPTYKAELAYAIKGDGFPSGARSVQGVDLHVVWLPQP